MIPVGGEQVGWYCVRAQPRREHVAAESLRRALGLEALCPRIRFQRATRRGKVWFREALFPGYCFARFDLSLMLKAVQYSPGVAGIVRFGDRHPRLPDRVIDELRRGMDGAETRTVEWQPGPGEEAWVTAGPFQDLCVVVTRLLPARERVRVLVDFLGRQLEADVEVALLVPEVGWRRAVG